MLYRILRSLFRLTFKVFFKNTFRNHPERIPYEGPLVICANHPGAFLDPIVIATVVKRRIFFLAKGAVFKGPVAKWLFPKFNMIPVYRQQDDPSMMGKNEETFVKCYEHLGNGGTILIFPEGVSITERKLRPLKTGAARIALGAEQRYENKLNVKIACIGLNYEDPHTFRRDVYIGFSEPINVSEYTDKFREKGFEAAEELTEEIRRRLEAEMIITSDQETDTLVQNIERLYKEDLMREQRIESNNKPAEFHLTQRIVETVDHYRRTDPERVKRISSRIRNYFSRIEKLGLSDRIVRKSGKGGIGLNALKDLLMIIFGFPFYLYGLLHNYIPFFGASLLSRKLLKAREWRGAVGAAAGMLFFLIWYITLGIISWHYIHKFHPVEHPAVLLFIYIITWPASGLFAWLYYRNVYYVSRRWLMISLFFRRAGLVSELVVQRNELIAEFERAAEEMNRG